jgi:methionyl aminopeptidase
MELHPHTSLHTEHLKIESGRTDLGDSKMGLKPHPDFLRAGEIAARVLDEVTPLVKPGVKIIKICALAEKRIIEFGGRPAFPCNVSINEEAAHYSSPYADKKTFPSIGLAKVDIGSHVNGHLCDTAVTVDLDGTYEKFVFASDEALDAAVELIRPGVKLGEVGAVIEKAIKKHGLRPVHQLSGHQVKPWILHAGKNVPNIRMRRTETMEAGETYAVEPFATDGNGTIKNRDESFIFANNMSSKKKLDKLSLQIRNTARRRFGTLPWASRWLHDGKINVDAAIHTLARAGVISGYPVLVEGKEGLVSQSEHTLFVSEEGAIVTTKRNAG